jgi:7-carboxy-7-deazaguanine synthase
VDLTLPLNDIFGPTIQGEGPYMGRVVNFVRLGLCNLHCFQCDTKQTWDKDNYDLKVENPATEAQVIVDRVTVLPGNQTVVVISGGEPLMHQDKAGFRYLLKELNKNNYDVHIETNGTRLVRPEIANLITHFSVSPKITSALVSSADEKSKRIKMSVLKQFANYTKMGKACFKIVCATPSDVEEANALRTELELFEDDFWIMPAGLTPSETDSNTRRILPTVLKLGMNFSPRLHILTGVK